MPVQQICKKWGQICLQARHFVTIFCGIMDITLIRFPRRIMKCSATARVAFGGVLYIILAADGFFWTIPGKADDYVFALAASDPIRKATLAVGRLLLYTARDTANPKRGGIGSSSCAAAVISEKYIITNAECANPKKIRIIGEGSPQPIVRAELRLGLDGWSLKAGDVFQRTDLDTVFQVNLQSSSLHPASRAAVIKRLR